MSTFPFVGRAKAIWEVQTETHHSTQDKDGHMSTPKSALREQQGHHMCGQTLSHGVQERVLQSKRKMSYLSICPESRKLSDMFISPVNQKDTYESLNVKSINQPYPSNCVHERRVSNLTISPSSQKDTYDLGSVKYRHQPCLSISLMSLLLDDTSRALWKSSSSLMIFPDLRADM